MAVTLVEYAGQTDSRPELDELLDRLAAKICQLRLEMPALLFLEMHLPLLTIAHTFSLFVEPVMLPFLGAERIHTLKLLLSDRKNIEELMRRIESGEPLPGK